MVTTHAVIDRLSMDIIPRVLAQDKPGGLPPWVYVAALAAVALVFILPRILARRSRTLPSRTISETDRLKRSMEELLVQLQEFSREVNAALDTKMIALNRLIEDTETCIRDAETRIEELKTLLEKTESSGQPGTTPATEQPASARTVDGSSKSPQRRTMEETVLRLADEGRTDLEIAQATGMTRGEIELVLALRRKTHPSR